MSAGPPGLEDPAARSARVLARESFIGHGKRHPYRHALSHRRRARRHAHRARGRADLRLGRLRGALAVGSPLQPGDRDRPLPDPDVKVDATTVYTNNPVASAYRCFRLDPDLPGVRGPDGRAGRRARRRPLSLREKNFLSQRRRAGHGSGARVRADAGRDDAPRLDRSREPRLSRAPRRMGWAVAASFTPYGRMCWTRDSASAWVGMELDGTAVVRCAAPDVGGGQTSSLCAITAEVLGLDLDHVTAVGRDSHCTPRAGPPRRRASSDVGQRGPQRGPRGTPSSGRRRRRAAGGGARRRRSRGRPRLRPRPRRTARCRWRDVVKAAIADGRPVQALEKYDAPSAPTIDATTGQGKAFNDYTFGTHAIEVEIDEETGQTREPAGHLLRRRARHSSGERRGASSRAAPSRGSATRSWKIALDHGVSRNPHLADYKIPDLARRAGDPGRAAGIRRRARAVRREGPGRAGH